MDDGTVPILIGRNGVIVPDPLNRDRRALGHYAQGIDDVATFHGLSLVEKTDEQLQRLRAELVSALSSELDHERAAHALEWQAGIEDAEDAVALAHEDVVVLEGKSMAGPDESAPGRRPWVGAREAGRRLPATVGSG